MRSEGNAPKKWRTNNHFLLHGHTMQNLVRIQVIRPHKENLEPKIWPHDDVLITVFIQYYFCVWQADGVAVCLY